MTERCYAGCGAILPNFGEFRQQGHIIAASLGGPMTPENLRIICKTCNLQMATTHMFEWMKSIERTPAYADPAFEAYEYKGRRRYIDFQDRELRYRVTQEILVDLPMCGIISACTGSGKTAMCIEAIGKHMRGKILLWITEFKNIVESQFNPYNIASWKHAGFVPKNTAFLPKGALKHCYAFPGTCIIYSTIDTARKYYTKVCGDPRFLGFVIDESHHSDGDRTFDMLYDMKSRGCDVVLGLSATHTNSARTRDLFGEEPYLIDYTLLEGWRDGIIREVKILCCMLKKKLAGGKSSAGTLFDRVENHDAFLENLANILDRTQTRKGIIWCDQIEEANKWYELICDSAEDLGVCVYVDHTRRPDKETTEARKAFTEAECDAIMITAQKYSEGVDIKYLDFAGVISENSSTAERVYLQRVGRLLRNEGRPGPALFCNFAVVTDLETYTDQMKSVFIDYYGGIKRLRVPLSGSAGYTEGVRFDTVNNRIICENARAGADARVNIMFEFLDDMHVAEIFETRDAEFVADMLYNTRRGISFAEIKRVLREHGVDDPAEAQKFFGRCCANFQPAIARWWDIAKYLPIDYTRLLDLHEDACYATLHEARAAMRVAERELTPEQLMLTHWNDRYRQLMMIDPLLPKDWRGRYGLSEPKQYWDPNRKKLLREVRGKRV